jgi:hydroxypyruvate isomerase
MKAKTSRRAVKKSVPEKLKGRINHSVCRWCYEQIPLDDFCRAVKGMGLTAIDLLDPKDFSTIKKYGFTCSMVSFPTIDGIGGIPRAFNCLEHHDRLARIYEQRLKETAAAGFTHLICFSGNRDGLDDATGLANCAAGLKRILPLAERLKVTLCMELLNSKCTHPDYQCDHTAWGVELVRRVGSERFKLLYDIFHMQIMDGDVCDTIRENHQYFDHYHTGGVPGRAEIDGTQELNYARIMEAIVATGFKGYVAQEFVPARPEALASLRQGVRICDV